MTSRFLLTILVSTIGVGCQSSTNEEVSVPQSAEVFAASSISLPDSNIFRGGFNDDGTEFYFFRKVTPGQEDYRIFVSRLENGNWQPGEKVELGGDYSDMYPSLSPDNQVMVFSSYRPAPGDTASHANANLWYSERVNNRWGEPRFIASASTLQNYDAGPRFGSDGYMYFTSIEPGWRVRHSRKALWDGASFSNHAPDATVDPWRSWRDDIFVWDGIMSPDNTFLLLGVSMIDSSGRRLPSDLWVTENSGGDWSEPRPLAAGINTDDDHENFVTFDPRGTTLYFVRGFRQYYRVSIDAALGR